MPATMRVPRRRCTILLLWIVLQFSACAVWFLSGHSIPRILVNQQRRIISGFLKVLPPDLEELRKQYNISSTDNRSRILPADFKLKIEQYLKQHKERCQKITYASLVEHQEYCPCMPDTLVGAEDVVMKPIPFEVTEADNPGIQAGGHWHPVNCTARQRLALIIPYRNRSNHLKSLLYRLHPLLQRQHIDYTIYVVEQNSPESFNKGSLMNIGFIESRRERPDYDCFIFHDVDMLPEDDRHFYMCRDTPLHLGAYHDRHNYSIIYTAIFGAVTVFRPQDFIKINGFSTRFFGWGGEDDEMFKRTRKKFNRIERDPREVAGFKVFRHERDSGNVQKNRTRVLYNLGHIEPDIDGLNSIIYNISHIRQLPLYTWILANVLVPET